MEAASFLTSRTAQEQLPTFAKNKQRLSAGRDTLRRKGVRHAIGACRWDACYSEQSINAISVDAGLAVNTARPGLVSGAKHQQASGPQRHE